MFVINAMLRSSQNRDKQTKKKLAIACRVDVSDRHHEKFIRNSEFVICQRRINIESRSRSLTAIVRNHSTFFHAKIRSRDRRRHICTTYMRSSQTSNKKKRKQKQTRLTVNLQREINQSRFTCEIDYNFLVLKTTKLPPENRGPNEILDLSTFTIRARRISRANAAGPRNKYRIIIAVSVSVAYRCLLLL